MKALKAFMAMLVLCLISGVALAQPTLKVMYYNVLNFPGSTPERAEDLKKILDFAKPDVLVINELLSREGAELILKDALPSQFERAQFIDGPDSDNMLFFDTNKLALLGQKQIATDLRDISEYKVHWKEADSNAQDSLILYLYSVHLKASTGSENEQKRENEVMDLLEYLGDRTETQNIIVGGDFNFYNDDEDGFEALLTVLEDPIDQVGDWHNNAKYAPIHTQSTRTTQFGGGAHGGMDDRFDFIFVAQPIMDGTNQVEYVAQSYQAVGQDGRRFNGSMIEPAENEVVSEDVAEALHDMSDHLPVMITLRAKVDDARSIVEINEQPFRYSFERRQMNLGIDVEAHITITDLKGRVLYSRSVSAGNYVFELPRRYKAITVQLLTEEESYSFKEIVR